MIDPGASGPLGPAAPTSPIGISGGAGAATTVLQTTRVSVSDEIVARLQRTGAAVSVDDDATGSASQDWWPLAMTWALEGALAGRAAAIVRPDSVAQISEIAAICNEARIPLTTAAGRSGVCGNAVPVFGGVVLDMCGIAGVIDVDDQSLTVNVAAGTFGDHFEDELRRVHTLTAGHWPQSMSLSTIGGWVACRGAGQFSTRYGKIEDIVVGLDVTLADGRQISTGGQPRQAAGPDLTQLFVGSEGTIGIITAARLKLHPLPPYEQHAAFTCDSFEAGLDACRRVLRRGGTPAVLRLYDVLESKRNFDVDSNVVLVLDEGDPALVDANLAIINEEFARHQPADVALVTHWMGHRNDVAGLESLISKGFVIDTMEIAAPWRCLDDIYRSTRDVIGGIDGVLSVSAHQSHAYLDGACLYFTFAGRPSTDATGAEAVAEKTAFYRRVWDAGSRNVLERGGALSHHHGIGLNRGRFMAEALGGAFAVLGAVKSSLDPMGILNPGKLGLAHPYGALPGWE